MRNLLLFLASFGLAELSTAAKYPEYLCVKSKLIWGSAKLFRATKDTSWNDETNIYWEHHDTFNNYLLYVANNTWAVGNYSTFGYQYPQYNTIERAKLYCTEIKDDFKPNFSNPGNPNDCNAWSKTFDANDEIGDCAAFDSSLFWIDYVVGAFAFICISILLLFMCPCGKFHEYCKHTRYDGANLETYEAILEMHGIDPKSKKSKRDKRTIGALALKHDLMFHKVVWHNDYYKDFLCFFRMNHPLLSLFYGHTMHPYDPMERRVSFIGVQLFAIGFAAIITALVALIQQGIFNGGDPQDFSQEEQWLIGLAFDLLFGSVISAAEFVFEVNATCEWSESCGKCLRSCIKKCGHCVMFILIIFAGLFGCLFIWGVWAYVSALYGTSFANEVLVVGMITYFFGLFFAWFLIDTIVMMYRFHRIWRLQHGDDSFDRQKCNPFFNCINPYCVTSWCCCCSCVPFYYLCCWHCILRRSILKHGYPKDGSGNVIGSESGEFVITWQDYQVWKNGDVREKLMKRDVLAPLSRSYGKVEPGLAMLEVKVGVSDKSPDISGMGGSGAETLQSQSQIVSDGEGDASGGEYQTLQANAPEEGQAEASSTNEAAAGAAAPAAETVVQTQDGQVQGQTTDATDRYE